MVKMYSEKEILSQVNLIRKEIGHEITEIRIKDIYFEKETNELWIITEDRPDKSAIIGKGGWVVGKLREKLKINKIHVESYGDFLVKEYELKLAEKKLNEFKNNIGLQNLNKLIKEKLENIYTFNLTNFFKNNDLKESKIPQAVVALSGGVDSSFSLIIAKQLGFNPIAITIDPGTIILPNQFKNNISKLCETLEVKHEYIENDSSNLIRDALNGKYHPCGRCSKSIEEKVHEYCLEKNIKIMIYGDMLSTGRQSLTKQNDDIYRLNLPASLAIGKEEIKSITREYGLEEFDGFGCPLLYEVHKKYPHFKKYSIQRILRETRASALEPGEALNLIWSFYKTR